MKKILFKLITRFFKSEIEDAYITELLPTYKIDVKDKNMMEKISELFTFPEFKIYMQLLSNRKGYLGRKILGLKSVNRDEVILQNAFMRGQAYDATATIHFIRHINRTYKKQNKEVGSEKDLGEKNG